MSAWAIGVVVLVIGGLLPALALGSVGRPTDRLVGLELAGSIGVLVLVLGCQAEDQPGYLDVPLVLALLSVAGILVYTRLLRPR